LDATLKQTTEVSTAARPPREALRGWHDDDGHARDGYGRDAEACRESSAAASEYALKLRAMLGALEAGTVTLGRLGGRRQHERLQRCAEVFELVAERDAAFADQLATEDRRWSQQ
jgi:hypothetical protein